MSIRHTSQFDYVRAKCAMSVISYRRLLLVPGSSGVWDGKPPSSFRIALQAQLETLLQTESLRLHAHYNALACNARQANVEHTIATARHSAQIWVGHSEGGARLLHALRNPHAASHLTALVLVSPAYAIKSVGAVDVDAAIQTLELHNVRVLLVDTEHGFAGSSVKYKWPNTRGKLAKAMRLNPSWHSTVVKHSYHSLRKGQAEAALHEIVHWIGSWNR